MMLKLAKLGIAMAVLAVLIVPAAYAGVPDVTQSFFVPQAGPIATPCEGSTGVCGGVTGRDGSYAPTNVVTTGGAIGCALRCPNNETIPFSTITLRNWARLKVVVKASDGTPIVGIPASDICVLFNGGRPSQGFTGVGDDTIIANFQFNTAANCPDVRCVQADAPTDANGVTYISWMGHNPADPPGQASRDPLRKWGGYAGDLPVMVLGFKLQGKLTSASPLGSYTAHVKSFDQLPAVAPPQGTGETVDFSDFNSLSFGAYGTTQYNWNLDNVGTVSFSDRNNLAIGHYLDKCNQSVSGQPQP